MFIQLSIGKGCWVLPLLMLIKIKKYMSKKYKISNNLINKHTKLLKLIENEIDNTANYNQRHQLLKVWKEKRIYIQELKVTQKKLLN